MNGALAKEGGTGTAGAKTKNPYWYKQAIVYQLHLRSFYDSNADGIGDLPGLTQKLDYLQDLGVTALWLMPFYPSPLRDDGYDIADYYSINPMYGTVEQFQTFLHEAHTRGLRVITELVINHTSDQHPWFQRARRAPKGNPLRDYYVWTNNPKKYKEARIIFRDFEPSNWTWDSVAQAYFWHRFYFHQPDLNFDNPVVHEEIIKILNFWLDMGVDGLRLDAIPYLYEREGTSCENLPETHEYLKTLRKHVDERYGDRMLLAEANQWPEDSVTYFGSGRGDECHMAFHFPVMPRLFMSVRMEDRVPIIDILDQTPAIPETSQWAIFLRNHDELTLEMVTDEERDYMYRVYASDKRARINLGIRRRLAPLLGNDRRKIELLHLLLFSLPGTPVMYYGDEIGMGDNIFLGDRNGVRTPMQWSSDKNAGFSRANPHALFLPIIYEPEYHYEAINVEAQLNAPNSLLRWIRRALTLRKRWRALGQGTIEFLNPENRKVLAFFRKTNDEVILVVANLSRFAQAVDIDLSLYARFVPVELFGQTEFPPVTEKPYSLTLSPYAVFWFHLRPAAGGAGEEGVNEPPLVEASSNWRELLEPSRHADLEAALPRYIRHRRWFGGKSKAISAVRIRDLIEIDPSYKSGVLTLLSIEYRESEPDEYVLPIGFAASSEAEEIRNHYPHAIICGCILTEIGQSGVLYDAIVNPEFARTLAKIILDKQKVSGRGSSLAGSSAGALAGPGIEAGKVTIGKAEQSNSSVLFEDQLFFKLFRRVEAGMNPDYEVGRFLTEKNFKNIPPVYGALEYGDSVSEKSTIGILTGVVSQAKDGWEYTLDALGRFYERVASWNEAELSAATAGSDKISPREVEALGAYRESARLLGQRTAELHLALGSDYENKDFAPEGYNPFSQRAFYQSLRNVTVRNIQLLRRSLEKLSAETRALAEAVINLQTKILEQMIKVTTEQESGMRIRCHGDYHLGQVLHTGKDFYIIDFEGEPARTLGERKIKRTPLRDVAGMMRSIDYASYAGLLRQVAQGKISEQKRARMEQWSRYWSEAISAVFLKEYRSRMGPSELLPKSDSGFKVFLRASILEKALYEIGYEINNRPDWLKIPLQGVLQLFGT